jgi:hypothetical protein
VPRLWKKGPVWSIAPAVLKVFTVPTEFGKQSAVRYELRIICVDDGSEGNDSESKSGKLYKLAGIQPRLQDSSLTRFFVRNQRHSSQRPQF